ncbi:hypothetical protein U9M48_015902 [Paspalum notatum var. saurae]|uniref:Uncharacterized protein n=1 Tax=Paspalum notatum var. saurae TaxID=547442 RepID=A0AAQ3WM74_PASNO
MPVTRRRAAATAPVVVQVEDGEEEEERYAAIDISSGSEAGSESKSEDEEDSESEEEEDTSDEDFVDISDSDSEVGDGGDSSEDGSEAEAKDERLSVDRSEAACNKIASLLRSSKMQIQKEFILGHPSRWANEAERHKVLEEKHSRGDDARRVRALSRPKSAGNNLKGKTKLKKEKHKSRSGRPDCQSNITEVNKGKKRPAQSSKFDLPNKRSKKEVSPVPSGKKCTGSRRAKKNRARLDKSICTGHGSSSSLCNDNREKNNSTLQTNCHIAPLHEGPSNTEVGMRKRVSGSEHRNRINGRHAQSEGRYVTPGTHVEVNHENFVVVQHPSSEKPQWHPPLRDIANALPHPGGGSHPGALFNTTMGFRHQNGAMTGLHAPAHFRGRPPNQQRVAFPSPNIPQTVYHPHPEAAYVVPRFRYPSGVN